METQYTDYPTCPVCGTEDQDWWDGLQDVGKLGDGSYWEAQCMDCDSLYYIRMYVAYTFSTYPYKT